MSGPREALMVLKMKNSMLLRAPLRLASHLRPPGRSPRRPATRLRSRISAPKRGVKPPGKRSLKRKSLPWYWETKASTSSKSASREGTSNSAGSISSSRSRSATARSVPIRKTLLRAEEVPGARKKKPPSARRFAQPPKP